MECQASWIPNAVATLLRSDRTAQPIISWLTVIRDSTEEYDPLVTVRPTTPEPAEDSESPSPDSAFDEILSQLGQEIFKLDEYQKYLTPEEKEVSLSILNIFDECLHEFPSKFEEKHCFELTPEETVEDFKVYNGAVEVCKIDGELIECIDIEKVQCEEVFEDSLESEVVHLKDSQVRENGVANSNECNCDTSSSDLSFVSSTPAKCDKASDINKIFYQGEGTPIPPRRARLKTPSSTSSYDNMEFTDAITAAKRLDSDSESTCWRYQECNVEAEDSQTPYGAVWSHSSGFHNSDEIIRRVLLQNHATISRVSYDTASEFEPARFSVYALHEEGDRCSEPVATMTPDKPTDDGYEPVRDAITTDNDNIYEEIDFNNSYTDEGFSCGGSVEVESCSISASSEGVGRDSPLYINLRDHGAYEVSRDVIYWKNLLLDPFYNEDEEDEWISPEESVEYAREARPPLVIPRITQYRAPRRDPRPQIPAYNENYDKVLKSQSKYGRIQDWSPTYERSRLDLERGYAQAAESPPLQRIHKRLGASTENLLAASRRPNHLPLPASSSDSLDVEVRPDRDIHVRGRKSRSMVTTKRQIKSPIPTPRQPPPPTAEVPVVYEGPVKRTKFFEGGKKSKKNWVDCYMVLTPTALYFYKDQKTFHGIQRQPGTPSSPSCPRMEVALPLLNAHVVPCLPSHTRRYLKSLELTVSYDRYLLQDETEEGARIWLKEIQKIIYDLGPLNPHENLHSPLQSSRSDLESLGRTPPASRHSNRSKQKAGGSSNEDESDSTEVSKSHVKSRLRKFFAKRPSMEVLVKKGIYKGSINP